MTTQYEKTVWLEDERGERYVCYFNDEKEHPHDYDKLDEEEKSHCKPVEFPWN